ncbi:hypothetical protein PR048_023617 [Dryococelus australis]|uniref:Endonuclease/exonuclease/phosphatase domain-containing protein n=1 Tax=Dryococelus australis TaxID=614101 RepID=A0ABQ9GUP4_9NEOP|nr:hypothetical protein PR048_023617 [Dryococelus australis]
MVRSSLHIATWNARSLCHKVDELLHLIVNEKLDVLLITDTWLSNTIRLLVPGFRIHRRDRPDRDGVGVAIVIRDNILHQLTGITDMELSEAVAITIAGENNPITLACIYIPPDRRLPTQDLETIRALDPQLLWGGVFNITHHSWGCPTVNRRGQQLRRYTMTHQLTIYHPGEPTYIPDAANRHPQVLDFFLPPPGLSVREIKTHYTGTSDHSPVSSYRTAYR